MSLISAFEVTASGLSAQRLRMDIASTNLANAQTTRGPDGKPFSRLIPEFEAVAMENDPVFSADVNRVMAKVELNEIKKDQSPPKRVYDPGHPDADGLGFITLPNINLMQEMADLLMASRAYESNVTAFNTTKSMALKAIEIGKA